MNTLGLLTISSLTSLIAVWMISKRERLGRMGVSAIGLFLLACMGIYAGAVFILPSFGQIPMLLWLTYCIIPLYFVAVAGYWLLSLWATWRNWGMCLSIVRLWKSSGCKRSEAVPHIQKALLSQGGRVPYWVATCLFWVAPRKRAKVIAPMKQAN